MINYFLIKNSYSNYKLFNRVNKELGPGFLESVYKQVLAYEFTKNKFHYEKEKLLRINYKDTIIDKAFYADFIIENKIILEIKTVRNIEDIHIAQLLNYLKASGIRLGYIINFAKLRLEWKRLIY
ncbi:MAG: GxxExxY protein [Candidatus Cloacimonetes bacterium]|nr:GxxExxY protein [Candidatus Cloacimonadota bacterium]